MSTTAEEAKDGINRTADMGRVRTEDEQARDRARAEAFEREDREEATGRYPELANAYALEELAAQFARDNLEEAVRAAFEGQTREFIATKLRRGEMVLAGRLEEVAARSRDAAQELELRRDRPRTVELEVDRDSDQER